ncbi:hypothetical protein ES705_42274 [subsurface metagenome]
MIKKIIKRIRSILRFKNNNLKLRGTLSAVVIKPDGEIKNLGIISKRCITITGVFYLVDGLRDPENYPLDFFHDSGTGVTAEAVSDAELENPCGEARDEGTKEEGDSANIFKTVATHTYSGTFVITEHGLFFAPAGGALWDRSVFEAINVVPGYRIKWEYLLTIDSGG